MAVAVALGQYQWLVVSCRVSRSFLLLATWSEGSNRDRAAMQASVPTIFSRQA